MSLVDELNKLHEVQKIDTQIYQREQALKMLDSGEGLKQMAIALLKQHDVAAATRQKLETEQKNKELELKSVESKRDAVHEKLYSGRVHNPKELGDLQTDEEVLNHRISDLDGPLLEIMEQVEQAKADEAVLNEKVSTAKRRWKETVTHTQAETERLTKEIAALKPEREILAAQIDKHLLRRYDDIRSRRESLGIVVTGNDSCPGCHVKLTSRVMNLLYEGEELTECDNCDRILLWRVG